MEKNVKIYAGRSSEELASKVASIYGQKFAPVTLGKIHKGKPQDCILESNVFFIQSGFSSMDHMVESLRFVKYAREKAHKVNVVIPYFGFSSKTRYDDTNDLVNFFDATGADRLISMDLYADMCKEFSEITIEQMYVAPLFAKHIKETGLSNLLIVAPGEWASKRARILKDAHLDAQIVSCDISKENGEISHISFKNHCHFRGKNVILLKEVLHSGETTIKIAEQLKQKGVASVHAMAAHAMLEPGALQRIENSCIESIVITDSIPLRETSPKLKLVSVAETIADKIHQLASVKKFATVN